MQINETYKAIADGKKKYMKILKEDIQKAQYELFQKTKKEIKKEKQKINENLDFENIQMSLNLEFEEKSNDSKKKILFNNLKEEEKNFRNSKYVGFFRRCRN